MGPFTPKYPQGAGPQRKESRRDRAVRAVRDETARMRAVLDAEFKDAELASEERSIRFWQDYERRNGPGSVDWSA